MTPGPTARPAGGRQPVAEHAIAGYIILSDFHQSEVVPLNDPHPDSRTPAVYPRAATIAQFEHNLAAVRARMATACRISGRDRGAVRLLAVSKGR